nr:putative ACR, COG2135 [uncultured bacterium]
MNCGKPVGAARADGVTGNGLPVACRWVCYDRGMCGRYTLTKPKELLKRFPNIQLPMNCAPRYNIAPTQPVLAVTNAKPEEFQPMHWGLIPSWAKDPSIGSRMINARAETLREKPAYRTAFRRRRCLVPADGFYEWKPGPAKTKTPTYIRMKSGEPFMIAGLWEVWTGPDGEEIPSCTLVTAEPNELVKPIHDRMIVILPEEHFAHWLDPSERPPDALETLLKPYPADEMEAYAVSTAVNSPKHDTPDCIEPAGASE